MKKLFFIFVILCFASLTKADEIRKSGFLSGEWDLNTEKKITDPTILEFIASIIK